MSCKRVEFTFSGNQVKEPVIFQLGHKFPVITNIRRAQIEDDLGWVVLELNGEIEAIDSALDWVRSLGIVVRSIEGDIVAGD